MNKSILIVGAIIIISIIIVGAYLLGYGIKNPYSTTTTINEENIIPKHGDNPQQNQPVATSISIKNFAFNPAVITIKTGTTITWTNNDPMPHQIKSDTFNSNILNNGNKFSFKFDKVGKHDYICSIHPSMKGEIVVTQ